MFSKSIAGSILAALAVAGSAVPLRTADSNHHMGRTRYPKGYGPRGRGFHPNINRNTGRPHEHRREIARRLRQKGIAA